MKYDQIFPHKSLTVGLMQRLVFVEVMECFGSIFCTSVFIGKLQKFLLRQKIIAKHITVWGYRAVICWKLLLCCNTKHLLFVLSL